MKLERTDLTTNLRQIIILALLEDNVHMETWQMNDLLVTNFPHLYRDHRPAAHASLSALENRGYVYKGVNNEWRCRPLGKRLLSEIRDWLMDEAEGTGDTPTAVAAMAEVVPIKKP